MTQLFVVIQSGGVTKVFVHDGVMVWAAVLAMVVMLTSTTINIINKSNRK